MLQVRPLPLRVDFGPPPRIAHAHPHRPETLPVRAVRPVVPPEAAAQAPPEFVPQPDVRAAAAPREDARVSRVRARLQAQGQPYKAHGRARSRLERAGEAAGAEVGQAEEGSDDRRAAG